MPALRAVGPVDPDDHGHGHGPDADDDHPHFHDHDELPRHGGRFADILEAIGHTPLVEIPRMSPKPDVQLYAKLEMLNPTGSVKDRAAKYLIEDLEAARPAPRGARSSSSRPRATPASPSR